MYPNDESYLGQSVTICQIYAVLWIHSSKAKYNAMGAYLLSICGTRGNLSSSVVPFCNNWAPGHTGLLCSRSLLRVFWRWCQYEHDKDMFREEPFDSFLCQKKSWDRPSCIFKCHINLCSLWNAVRPSKPSIVWKVVVFCVINYITVKTQVHRIQTGTANIGTVQDGFLDTTVKNENVTMRILSFWVTTHNVYTGGLVLAWIKSHLSLVRLMQAY